MSRLELNAIQTKLKAAIQSHQMLVVKMKGDNQNASFKKGLAELQEEIKRLSEEQKKIVVKLRESLVKSSSQPPPQPQPQPQVTPIASVGQTITAIGQPRLISFPTQGGATILPVGMVAVPLAHMQRPAVGMAIHPVSAGQISPATSISLIPTGIISSGCNINLNPISSGGTIGMASGIGSIIQGNIAINSINPLSGNNNSVISSTTVTTSVTSGLLISDSNLRISVGSSAGCGVVTTAISSCVPSSSIAVTNATGLIINNNINNHNDSIITNNGITPTSSTISVSSTSTAIPQPLTNQVNTAVVSSSGPGIVISPFPQQPLVQPQLLQQQQQQILQMIQQQQQQPQQRLASHTPIKVPQYTASVIRPNVSSTSVQYCNIAPAPSTIGLTPAVRPVPSSSHVALSGKSVASKETVVSANTKEAKEQLVPKTQHQKQPLQQQHQQQPTQERQPRPPHQQQPLQEQQQPNQTSKKQRSSEEEEKIQYMQALDLYTDEALKEMMNRRSERKRRTTANPNYSFGFEISRRDRNGSIWTTIPPKKSRITRGKNVPGVNSWTDSTSSHHHQRASNKSHKSNDNHDDYCAVCGKGGQLLMCETCRLVYHLDCLSPPLTEAPKYAWSCPKCLVSGRGLAHLNSEALAKVHSYIAKKAAKEDEKKKVQRKGREINTEKSFLDNRSKELDSKMKEQLGLQSKLLEQEKKVKEELSKLSDFVRVMRESRTAEHNSVVISQAQ